jgi:beta-lactamase class A
VLIVVFLLTNVVYLFQINRLTKKAQEGIAETVSSDRLPNGEDCNFQIARLSGYKYIKPLMYAERTCEAPMLTGIKSEVEKVVQSYQLKGVITSASVYLRLFNKGEWISIGDQHKYSPGSLLKVPELITFMKMNEREPGLLDRKLTYDQPLVSDKVPTYTSRSIELGKSYTIRELLHYMIAYSDNHATALLNRYMDIPTFKKVFTDLGMPAPDLSKPEYLISAKDYSLFMKVLYNASYLSNRDSEFCTELLSHCNFKEGLMAGIPADSQVAHKFGEGGPSDNPHLSESGIVFINGHTYLLTVMTKGHDMRELPAVIRDVSNVVYSRINYLFQKNA